ncbi:hypothetical protein [Stenotrophomonas acidaminiphila]|uniref:hypothetical protein n=1 Tax=Stenotrophomonas acidaminiphila TaxID=128780 RepID=UPI0028AFEE54|nr:hypothetical protein [Stenotrophomonas acidaminiphila]
MLLLTKTNVVSRAIKLRLPTERPNVFNEGDITVKVTLLPKDELRALLDADQGDAEFLRRILVSLDGLGDEAGTPISGDAALAEVYSGQWSAYLQNAIIQDYLEQYGDARAKNSKTSRGR